MEKMTKDSMKQAIVDKLRLNFGCTEEEATEANMMKACAMVLRDRMSAHAVETRSKVRKAMPKEYAYILDELIHTRYGDSDKRDYYENIISTIIDIDRAENFIIAMCNLIKRLIVDHLHLVGDVFDRGPRADIIMDTLMNYHSVDIQWGNHDVVWMGAASGHGACICNVIRMAARYGNLATLEEGYGINLIPLATFALTTYADADCNAFRVHYDNDYNTKDLALDTRMHKAITIMQFKLEGQLIKRHPEYDMEDRLLLDKMDIEKKSVRIGEKEYPLKDTNFPTVDWNDPYQLSPEEADVMDRLTMAFMNCEKLQKHVRFLFTQGSLYKVHNGNLLYHGCVPMNEDGTFTSVEVYGKKYTGKALYDVLENYARKGYYAIDPDEKRKGLDTLWFIWENQNSPVFGKAKMTTFERYFVADKSTYDEPKNPYYQLLENEDVVNHILEEFGLNSDEAHIINGHIPIEAKRGESPVKCNGKLLIIDGGFSKAYYSKTGIAGYTLIYNSYGLRLVAHEPFESTEAAIEKESDIHSDSVIVDRVLERKLVGDTDDGRDLKEQIADLEVLLRAYRSGQIAERL